jgi:4-amino-4-deoxy-L-arabinose transferase-like glycosyltransferase
MTLLNKIDKHSRSILFIVVVVQILAGTIYSVYLGNELRFLPDEEHYFDLATNIVERLTYSIDGQNPTAFRAPGYPFFLSFFRYLGANILMVRLLNYLLLAASTCLVYLTLQKQDSSIAGLLGAFMVFVYPALFFTASTLYPQTLSSFLFVAIIYVITGAEVGLRHFLLIGLLFAWLILTVPTFAFTLLVFTIWLIARRYRIRDILAMLAIVIFLISAWSIRNYQVFDSIVFISTNGGENLLLGNSENTTPNAGRRVNISKYERATEGMTEVQRDRYLGQQAFDYMRNNKARSLELYVLKVLNYFNYRNELVTETGLAQIRDVLMLLTYGLLLFFIILRLLLLGRYRLSPFEALLIIIYVANAFFSAIFFTRIRFRLPFDYLAIMIVALFLANFLQERVFKSDVSDQSINEVY